MKRPLAALLLAGTVLGAASAYAAPVFMLQFGSFESREEAEAKLTSVKKKHAGVLSRMESGIREVTLPPDNLTVYRTQAGPLATRADAQSVCSQLASNGDECYVVETAMAPTFAKTQVAEAKPVETPAPTPAPTPVPVPPPAPPVEKAAPHAMDLSKATYIPPASAPVPDAAPVAKTTVLPPAAMTAAAPKPVTIVTPPAPAAAPTPAPMAMAAAPSSSPQMVTIPKLSSQRAAAAPVNTPAPALPPAAPVPAPVAAAPVAAAPVTAPSVAPAVMLPPPVIPAIPATLPEKSAQAIDMEKELAEAADRQQALSNPQPFASSSVSVSPSVTSAQLASDQTVKGEAQKPSKSIWDRWFGDEEEAQEKPAARELKMESPKVSEAVPVEPVAATPAQPVPVFPMLPPPSLIESPAPAVAPLAAPASVPVAAAPLPTPTPVFAPEPAPVPAAPVVTAAPVIAPAVVTEAQPFPLPPPPAPVAGAPAVVPAAPVALAPTDGVIAAPMPVLAADNSNVQVEEATRVPLTQAGAPVMPAPAPAPIPQQLSPSATIGQKTLWAQIGSFEDPQAALAFWDRYRNGHPDFPVVRVRVTSPYMAQQRAVSQVNLRVGPFARDAFISNLCSTLEDDDATEDLQCQAVTDMGVASGPKSGQLPNSRYRQ